MYCQDNYKTVFKVFFFLVHLVAFHPCNVAGRDETDWGGPFRFCLYLGLSMWLQGLKVPAHSESTVEKTSWKNLPQCFDTKQRKLQGQSATFSSSSEQLFIEKLGPPRLRLNNSLKNSPPISFYI